VRQIEKKYKSLQEIEEMFGANLSKSATKRKTIDQASRRSSATQNEGAVQKKQESGEERQKGYLERLIENIEKQNELTKRILTKEEETPDLRNEEPNASAAPNIAVKLRMGNIQNVLKNEVTGKYQMQARFFKWKNEREEQERHEHEHHHEAPNSIPTAPLSLIEDCEEPDQE